MLLEQLRWSWYDSSPAYARVAITAALWGLMQGRVNRGTIEGNLVNVVEHWASVHFKGADKDI
jgi:hypothetical protein